MPKTVAIRPPSAFQIEQAMIVLERARATLLLAEPDLPEMDPKLWADMLEGAAEGDDPYAIVDRLALAAVAAGDMADMVRRRKMELGARQARFEHREEQLRGIIQQVMEALDLRSIERVEFTAAIGRGVPRIILTAAPEELPRRFQRITVEPDKVALQKALKGGEAVHGAELSNPAPILVLRTS